MRTSALMIDPKDEETDLPPDSQLPSEGRDRHVRDVTAQRFASSVQVVSLPPSPPTTPSSSPVSGSPIKSALKSSTNHRHPAPPLTPRSSTDSLPLAETVASRHNPTFLDAVFPKGIDGTQRTCHTVGVLPHNLQGVVVDGVHNGLRSLYVKGVQHVSAAELRDVVVDVLDQADERIDADEVIFVLEKKKRGLRELLQGLLYVGGTVVRDQSASKDVVLVGIEI